MFAIVARLLLLLAVLIQYTPVRVCALERVALGWSCHDAVLPVSAEHAHIGAAPCGSQADPAHDCICEQAKVDGQHLVQGAKASFDSADLALIPAAALVDAHPALTTAREWKPPPAVKPARHHPLLI